MLREIVNIKLQAAITDKVYSSYKSRKVMPIMDRVETHAQSVPEMAYQYHANKALCGLMLLLFVLISLTYSSQLKAEQFDLFTPPGELYDIGTHKLHLYCKGEGKPTVIIDTGMGSLSLEWTTVKDNLSQQLRVCTYDRAGYGWSEPGPVPRTSRQIATELNELIVVSGLEGPFILVGHSFGGYNIRYFAHQYPDKVAGMVLVDASHPEQFERMDLVKMMSFDQQQMRALRQTVSIPVLHKRYPEDVKLLAFRLMMEQKSHYARLDELEHFQESAKQLREIESHLDIPLVVLTRGMRAWPQDPMGTMREIVWQEMQSEMSHLSTLSLQVIANYSGHSPHMDQPMLVSSVILNTAGAASELLAGRDYYPVSTMASLIQSGYASHLSHYFKIPMVGANIVGQRHPLYDNTTIIAAIYRH